MLYDLLEHEMAPLYYNAPVPSEWIKKMKSSVVRYAPAFSAQRMVLDYFNTAYLPAIANAAERGLNAPEALKNLNEHEKNLGQLRAMEQT